MGPPFLLYLFSEPYCEGVNARCLNPAKRLGETPHDINRLKSKTKKFCAIGSQAGFGSA